jgi:hypothetical protein
MTPLLKDIKRKPNSDERAEIYRTTVMDIQRELHKIDTLETLRLHLLVGPNDFDKPHSKIMNTMFYLRHKYILEIVKEIQEQINLDALLLTTEKITNLLQFNLFEPDIWYIGRTYSSNEYLEKINFC